MFSSLFKKKMRTMAGFVFFSVLVACSMHHVFAIDCSSVNLEEVMSCDDCIRCGGYWCNKPREKDVSLTTFIFVQRVLNTLLKNFRTCSFI